MAKQTIKQRKAIRSAAARKGWETRRVKREHEATTLQQQHIREMNERMQNIYWRAVEEPREVVNRQYVAPPKPSLWQRIKRWFA